jgi:hypothetical protein
MERRKLILVLFCIVLSFQAKAQLPVKDTLNVVFHNILNFPTGGGGIVNRQDTLRKILQHLQPDVFMACEVVNSAGASAVLNGSLNVNGITYYQQAPFQTNTSSGNELQNMVYFNSNKLSLHSFAILQTGLRDINKYILYYNDPNLSVHNDTTFIDFYVTHLKASSGSTNAAQRNAEITVLRNHLITHPIIRNSVFGADLNIYTSSEAAYQTITTTGTYPFQDPINTPGSWNNNGTFASVHTQSTRTFQLGGDGASGGMDDRFDQMLTSSNIISGADRVLYLPGTYRAVGQDGLHYNQNLTDPPANLSEPADVINALFYMSDHLPVYMELEVTLPVPLPVSQLSLAGQLDGGNVTLEFSSVDEVDLFLERKPEEISGNARDFEILSGFHVKAGQTTTYMDAWPVGNGGFSYRLRFLDQNGHEQVSNTLRFANPELGAGLETALTRDGVELLNRGRIAFEGIVRLTDLRGRLILSRNVRIEAGESIQIASGVKGGMRLLQVVNGRTGATTFKKFLADF